MYHVGSSPEIINETAFRAVFDFSGGIVAICHAGDGETIAESNPNVKITDFAKAEAVIRELGYHATCTGWWGNHDGPFAGEYNRYVLPVAQAATPTPSARRGRPPVGPIVPVRMPQDLLDRIDTYAKSVGVTRSGAIRLACLSWVDEKEEPPQAVAAVVAVDQLVAEGYRRDDVLAAVDSLISAGLDADQPDDHTVLTAGEVDLLRDQLATTNATPDADAVLCTLEVATTRDVLQSACRTALGGEMHISESGRLGLEIAGGPVTLGKVKAELDLRGIESILEQQY